MPDDSRGGRGDGMKKIATLILEDQEGKILMYLRDNKETIPFPNHWDLFGGHIEKGESSEQALKREVKEELGIELENFYFFREYKCLKGDVVPNIKYVYVAKLPKPINKLTLHEGQKMQLFSPSEIQDLKIANILKDIILDYIEFRNSKNKIKFLERRKLVKFV